VSGDNLLRFDNGKNISQSQNLKIPTCVMLPLLQAFFCTLFNILLAIT
jgi:hypothetical protein